MKRICVFCGSSPGLRPEYVAAGRELGHLLAAEKIGVVYGGASIGVMGAVADGALAAGGEVIGIIPHNMSAKEIAHGGLTELRVVRTMHERKALMENLSSGFIALPGGFGTLEEFCEIVTWSQLGIHQKPVGLLNVAAYYDSFIKFVARAGTEGFIRPEHLGVLMSDADAPTLVSKLRAYRPAFEAKWLSGSSEA